MTISQRNPIEPGRTFYGRSHLALDLELFRHREPVVAKPRVRPALPVAGSAIHAAHPELAPYIEAALPAHDAPPLTAREIFESVGLGCIGTVRMILTGIARERRAEVTVDCFRRVHTINRYRRTAAAHHAPEHIR